MAEDPGWITVESLNPRGATAKQTEMSVRRGRRLARFCAEALAQAGTLEGAIASPPATLGTITITDMRFVFGPAPWRNPLAHGMGWKYVMEHWYTGGLERAERDALLNLPESSREKLHGLE